MVLRIILIISILASLGTSPVFLSTTQAEGPTVVINELLWMGSSASSADEWIELRNLSDQAIDVSGWQLTKKSGGLEVPMATLPAGKSIAANGYFLISNYAETNVNSTLGVTPDYVTTDVALSNSALQIKLYDGSHTLLDTADDGAGNPLAGTYDSAKNIFFSMERNIVPGDGAIVQNWHAATKSIGFKNDKPEFGTPGTASSNALPVAAAGPDQSGVVGQVVNFDGSDSFDPEGQGLTYAWDFGDSESSPNATPSHTYKKIGTFNVTLTVNDGIDAATDTVKITVEAAPTATTPEPLIQKEPAKVTAPATTTSCRGLKISELYPNPPGVDLDEFIELVNTADEEISLGGCLIATTVTRSFKLPDQILAVGAWLNVPKSLTHLTLANTGGTVRLSDTDSSELDRVSYQAAPEGASWSWFDGSWSWTVQPTPGAVNVLKKIDPITSAKKSGAKKSTTSTTSSKTKKTEPPAQNVSLKAIQELDSGDRIIIQGMVVAPVGALGATITYIQDEEAGVSLTIPNGEPALRLGDQIEVTGTVRLNQGRRRVAAAAHGIRILGQETVRPIGVSTDDVSPDQADQLVNVQGVVGLASGNRIEIDDGSGPVPIYIKSSTGIVRPKVKAGDTVEAVGIVSISTSGIRVLPRSQDDLRVERVLGAATTTAPPTPLPPSASNQSLMYWLLAGLGGIGAAAKPAWGAWRKSRE